MQIDMYLHVAEAESGVLIFGNFGFDGTAYMYADLDSAEKPRVLEINR